jgi:hypothetical protein
LGLKATLGKHLRLKGAGGFYSQNLLSTISGREVVNLFNGFISSPDQVRTASGGKVDKSIQTSRQIVLGAEVDPLPWLSFNIEGYVKDFNRLISVNALRANEKDPNYVQETSIARGIDLTTKISKRPFDVQLTYSLAKVTRKFGDIEYAPNFDRRHNTNVLVSFVPLGNKRSISCDVRFSFGTGLPFTQTYGFYEDLSLNNGLENNYQNGNGALGIYYGSTADYNEGRLPTFHRLDIGFKKSYVLGLHSSLEFSVGTTNAYNRQNVFYVDRVNLSKIIYQLPVLPYVGVSGSF